MKKISIAILSILSICLFASCDGGEQTSSSIDNSSSISENISTEDINSTPIISSEEVSIIISSNEVVESSEQVSETPIISEENSVEVSSKNVETGDEYDDGISWGGTIH